MKANLTNHCPPFFDGLLCWPPSNSNQTINLPCPPHYVLGYENPHDNAVATKYCNIYGEWYRNNEGVFWSNYTQCTPPPGEFITAIRTLEFPHSEYGKFCNATILTVSFYFYNY